MIIRSRKKGRRERGHSFFVHRGAPKKVNLAFLQLLVLSRASLRLSDFTGLAEVALEERERERKRRERRRRVERERGRKALDDGRRRRSLARSLARSPPLLLLLPGKKETHFRVGLVIVRTRVGQSGHPGAAQGRRGEQGAADKSGENHREEFFFFFFFVKREKEKRK